MKFIKYQIGLIVKDFLIIIQIKKKSKKPLIFLFGCSYHSNMGDQAITQSMIDWLVANYYNYHIFTFHLLNSRKRVLSYIRKKIKQNDMIFCGGGYHLTDLYPEQDIYCQLAKLFPDFPIMIFTQTINYRDSNIANKTASIFNSHGRITILCRDIVSYQSATKLFFACKLLLYPDIVTINIGLKFYDNNRKGILFCLRKDKEQTFSLFNKNDIDAMIIDCQKVDDVMITDTTLNIPNKVAMKNREKLLDETFELYSHFRVIITNKYHGMIFSLIAGTPVIVLGSNDHKFNSGKQWFLNLFDDYFYYCSTSEEVLSTLKLIYQKKINYKLPDYFKQNYWNVLKQKIAL